MLGEENLVSVAQLSLPLSLSLERSTLFLPKHNRSKYVAVFIIIRPASSYSSHTFTSSVVPRHAPQHTHTTHHTHTYTYTPPSHTAHTRGTHHMYHTPHIPLTHTHTHTTLTLPVCAETRHHAPPATTLMITFFEVKSLLKGLPKATIWGHFGPQWAPFG